MNRTCVGVSASLVLAACFSACSSEQDASDQTSGASGGGGTGTGTVAGTGGSGGEGANGEAARGGSSAGGEAGGVAGSAGASGGAGSSAGDSRDAGGGSGGSSGRPDGGAPGTTVTVFYLDISGGSVMATEVEDPEARTIVENAGAGPDGIALDVEQGHIYWTGMGVPAQDDGFVRRSDLDGSNIVTIVPEGGTFTPKQLKIDHDGGKLYWADREGMRVMRANLDGSELETLVTTGTTADDRRDSSNWCVGIALDVAAGYFYWTQKGPDNGMVGAIRRAHIAMPAGEDAANRSDIEVLFSGLPEPVDIDIDLQNRHIYWTDRGDDTINRAPLELPGGATAANRTDREILIEGVREAIGVTLDLEHGKLYFTGGTGGRVGMANLDGSEAVDLLTGRAALTGIAVAALR
jgi:hypothetical protein